MKARDNKYQFKTIDQKFWNDNDVFKTIFLDSLSVIFPQGEKQFIQDLRKSKEKINNENLLKEIDIFIKQEARHSREHIKYNKILDNKYNTKLINKFYKNLHKITRKPFSDSLNLSITAGAEHYTAFLSDVALRNFPIWFENVNEEYKYLWIYHCVEEIEHKHVCFDAYKEIEGKYFKRLLGYLIITLSLNFTLLFNMTIMLSSNNLNWKERFLFFKGAFKFLILEKQLFKMISHQVKYFHPNFHPNNLNSCHLVEKFKKEAEYVK